MAFVVLIIIDEVIRVFKNYQVSEPKHLCTARLSIYSKTPFYTFVVENSEMHCMFLLRTAV